MKGTIKKSLLPYYCPSEPEGNVGFCRRKISVESPAQQLYTDHALQASMGCRKDTSESDDHMWLKGKRKVTKSLSTVKSVPVHQVQFPP